MQRDFLSLSLKKEYRSPHDNVVTEMFIPVLSMTKIYKRSVGFFSSTSLIETTKGISDLVRNNGKIQIVASPKLSKEDIQAIETGYENRSAVIEKRLIDELDIVDCNYFDSERLNLLANLIAKNVLSIKIAFTSFDHSIGIYHEKMGIFEDFNGNKIVFDGSMNESQTAMRYNYETVNVYSSWLNEDRDRANFKIKAFDNIWCNYENNLEVMEFPEVTKQILKKYMKHDLTEADYNLDYNKNQHIWDKFIFDCSKGTENYMCSTNNDEKRLDNFFFKFPKKLNPKWYQKEAIDTFVTNDFTCLFAMATGTGKTLTSLFAANELSLLRALENILILVPLKDLVDQWEKDIKKYFSGTIILVRSGLDWKNQVSCFKLQKILNPEKKERLVIISTYDSFSLNKNKILDILTLSKTLIIADECHKTGAKTYRENLPEEIKFRIGLSATPKRPFDEKGTKAIFDYFDPHENPYEFSIGQAIENGMLCPYNYYPILVELTVKEMESYAEISEKINKLVQIVNCTTVSEEDEEYLEQLLKQRHRIIEKADNKYESFISIFLKEIRKYQNYTIVFAPDGKDENNEDLLKKYQTGVTQLAYQNKIYITTIEYIQGTSKDNLDFFASGQADIIFAKQRLNEGIDIPAAKRAFFISSSTSEREFIQRRGRVLRLHPGKTMAEIFDFVVIPPQSTMNFYDPRLILQIKESELKRVFDFAKTANNYLEVAKILHKFLGIEG